MNTFDSGSAILILRVFVPVSLINCFKATAIASKSAGIDEVSFKAQFTFVQEGRSSKQDFERITESARKIMGEGHPLIQILRRGIGVHHSGLQNKYRMAGAYDVLSIAHKVFVI